MKPPTLVNHPPDVSPPPGNQPVIAPIYQSVKYEFETIDETLRMLRGEKPGYFYMRASNPTTRQLELTLARMQGRDDCLATASGVNAIAQTLIALTKPGDHILCFVETYGPTRNIIRRLLARFGVEHTLLSIEDMAGVENVLASRPTRLVMFESPTNPVTKIADIERLVELAHRHGALAVIDNTFAGFHQHGEYDIDLFVHSLTKYASGTGDVMGGAVIGRRELIEAMRPDFSVLGALLDPHAAFLIQRGLKTYFVRYREQTRAAQAHCRTPGGTCRRGARALPGPAGPSAIRARAETDARSRHGGQLRPQAGQRGGAHVQRTAQVVCAHGQSRQHRFAGDAAAAGRQPRFHAGAAAPVRHRPRHRAPVDRTRGHRRSHRRHRPGPADKFAINLSALTARDAPSRDNSPGFPGAASLCRIDSILHTMTRSMRVVPSPLKSVNGCACCQRRRSTGVLFDPAAVLQDNSGAIDLRLVTLGQMLCTAPARSAELRAMWKECVITAAFALQVAPRLGGDANTSAIAGLLHRLGDMLTIRAIGEIEHASHVRLDSASKSDLCAAHGGELLDRTVRAWGIPARAAATAAEWRRLRDFPGAAADAAAVYLARLFAIELIAPQFCAPGVIECAIEEMGLDCASLASMRSDASIARIAHG